MFNPRVLRRLFWFFLLGVLIGVCVGKLAAASQPAPRPVAVITSSPAPVLAVASLSGPDDEGCGDEASCYAIIYTPGFCELVTKYGWWWYFAYCDQREGGRLMADDTIFVTELPDASVRVDLFRVNAERRIHMIRFLPARVKR